MKSSILLPRTSLPGGFWDPAGAAASAKCISRETRGVLLLLARITARLAGRTAAQQHGPDASSAGTASQRTCKPVLSAAALRRLGNAELAAVGLGFERSLVSAVTCFWPDSGYYSTPSRPQCFKLIQLAAAGQNNESRLGWTDPVSSQPFFDQHKTAAKSPFRPVSDGWRPLGQLCPLASVSYTTLARSSHLL